MQTSEVAKPTKRVRNIHITTMEEICILTNLHIVVMLKKGINIPFTLKVIQLVWHFSV